MQKAWKLVCPWLIALLVIVAIVGFFKWAAYLDALETAEQLRLDLPAKKEMLTIFGSPHKLRRLVEYQGQESKLHGSLGGAFFLLGGVASGSLEGESKLSTSLKLAWEISPGEYVISEVPLDLTRVALNENGTTPTVELVLKPCEEAWGEGYTCERDFYRYLRNKLRTKGVAVFLREHLLYARIHCRPEDWPIKVVMPLP